MTDDIHCGDAALASVRRRQVICIAAAGAAAALTPRSGLTAKERPREGDLLVADDVEKDPVAINANDLQPGKPVLAFPFDPKTKRVRNDSRLHKVVLIKFAESDLDAEIKQRAAGGVLAFSAICTHQACEVKTWIEKDKALVCFCHASKFLPLQAGKVADGPAPRSLPSLPLALHDGQLAVAGAFSARPGATS